MLMRMKSPVAGAKLVRSKAAMKLIPMAKTAKARELDQAVVLLQCREEEWDRQVERGEEEEAVEADSVFEAQQESLEGFAVLVAIGELGSARGFLLRSEVAGGLRRGLERAANRGLRTGAG